MFRTPELELGGGICGSSWPVIKIRTFETANDSFERAPLKLLVTVSVNAAALVDTVAVMSSKQAVPDAGAKKPSDHSFAHDPCHQRLKLVLKICFLLRETTTCLS